MSKKKKGSAGAGTAGSDDHVIEFTPGPGFDIRHAAKNFSQMMHDFELPLVLHLPHVDVEFEAGCTPQEIIEGYKQAMAHKVIVKHSNSNDKPLKPKR